MKKTIDKILLSAETVSGKQPNEKYGNTDVIVRFEDGETYAASFFTYRNIEDLTRKHQLTGENLGGKFFWASGMFLIDDCSRENVERVVGYLVEEGDFGGVFRKV